MLSGNPAPSMAEKPRSVVWEPKAKQDLRSIWRNYARLASPEIADKLLREFDQAGEKLGERPLLWRTRDEVMPGLRSVFVHPHTIFYRVTDARVEIVRLLHERRNFATVFKKDEQ